MTNLIRIDCPPEIFDVEGAYIMRTRRVPVWVVDALKDAKSKEEVYPLMAMIVPQWVGVVDPMTGELLMQPEDDPTVFGRLDLHEQYTWVARQFQVNPKNGTAQSGQDPT